MSNLSMKGFQQAIKNYLDGYAEIDEMFAKSYRKENKSIEECCNFILSEMQKAAKNGCIGATDDEVYSLAVHYFDEDDIENVEAITNFLVVSNQELEIELTDEEKAQARREAIEEYKRKELAKLTANINKTKAKKVNTETQQPSLF